MNDAWDKWHYRGHRRPAFAVAPTIEQESVWDYPRPPRIERDGRRVEVWAGPRRLARSQRALRVLETASPPTFYLPLADANAAMLEPLAGITFCEWKGRARYFALAGDAARRAVAWRYEHADEAFAALRECLAFYPGRVACFVEGKPVRTQVGGFYGGWITDELVGPFKGEPGTGAW